MTRNIDDFLGGYQPPRVTVSVTMRADLLARHGELQKAHSVAIRDDMGQNRTPRAPRILEEIRDLEAEMADSAFEFTFEALGRQDYVRLLAKHPPRREDRAERIHFNGETFPPALVAASAVDPQMTEDQAVALFERLSDGQFAKLWNAAITVNVGDDSAPKSVMPSASAALNGTSSTTADPEASLGASSSDES